MGTKINRLTGTCMAPLLLCAGLAAAATPDLRLVTAVADQDARTARALLDEGVDVNAARADGVTALLWAAHWDDLDTADLLLRAGANVNAADDHGVTPLSRASENGSAAMVEKLLEAGGDANAAQASGLTPLMIASRTGNVAVVEAFLARGADVSATTEQTHSTALMWAVEVPHPTIVRVLLDVWADPRTSTVKGFTPLMYAAENGDIEMAKTLIAAGVSVNDLSADGTHVLPFAIVRGQLPFALFLLEQGADPNGSIGGVHALHAAAGSVGTWLLDWYAHHGGSRLGAGFGGMGGMFPQQRVPLVQALLAAGADPNVRIMSSAMIMSYIGYPKKGAFEPYACGTGDLRGATPLWVAAFGANGSFGQIFAEFAFYNMANSSADVVRALLDGGADQHLTTDDGTTPLMAAAGLGPSTYTPREPRGLRSRNGEGAVKVLLEAGADINAVNEADFTALHGAVFRGLNEVVQFLVENGADINAQDFRGRTPYRMAEGAKQSFQFQSWPETADLLKTLGADTRLGIPGTVQERLRDIPTDLTGQP